MEIEVKKKKLAKLNHILLNSEPTFLHKKIDKYLRYEHVIYQIFRIINGARNRNKLIGFE